MTEALKVVTFIDLVFVLLLMTSGTVGGALGQVIYYLAFFIPVAIAFCYSKRFKRKREEERGLAEEEKTYLRLDKQSAILIAPLIPLGIGVIILSAMTTSIILGIIGFSSKPLPDAPVFELLITHALVPAILEEILFRYVPMKLLLPYSAQRCVLFSAIYFSLIHCNLFQIPYALVAGIILMLINVMTESIWPSLVLHLANNVLSVIVSKYCVDRVSLIIFVYCVGLVELVSIIYLWRNKEKYKEPLRAAMELGDGKLTSTYVPLVLVAVTLYVAFTNLFIK